MKVKHKDYYYSLDEDTIPSLEEYLLTNSTRIAEERTLSHDCAAKALLLIGNVLRESFSNLDDYSDRINDNLPLPHLFIKSGLQLLAASTKKDQEDAVKVLTDGLGLTADNRRRLISPATAFDETEAIKKTEDLSQNEAFNAVGEKLGTSKSTILRRYYEHKENVKTYYSRLCQELNLLPDDNLRESWEQGRYKPIEDRYFKINECIRRCLYPEQCGGYINVEEDHLYFTKIYNGIIQNIEYRTFEGMHQATIAYSEGDKTYQDFSIQKYFRYHHEQHGSLSDNIDKVINKLKSTYDHDAIFNRSLEKFEELAEKKRS
ncbi:hypothetical protein AB4589_15090 [Vibrio sp. 10N.222.49.A3]|uniref:hypothetical protein n=1 Tax=Vibrio sp. 10N.222.49.A3 TaxID=3229611 RepID=UPI0035545158